MANPGRSKFAALTSFKDGSSVEKGRATRRDAKRSHPDWMQTSLYLRRETRKQAKRILFDRDDLDFGELMESLLSDWVKKQKGKP
jgi:hypothetical protein